VTGLPIKRKPEWTGCTFGSDRYKLTCCVIGKNIILSKTWGYAELDSTKKYFSLIEKIADEVISEGEKYVLIEDYTNHEYATYGAKSYYINYQKENKRIKGLIFYGASYLFKLIIEAGIGLSGRTEPVIIADDYKSAIQAAIEI